MNEKTCYCVLKCMEMTNACAIGVQESAKVITKIIKKHNRLTVITAVSLAMTTLVINDMNKRIDILTKEIEELKRAEGE